MRKIIVLLLIVICSITYAQTWQDVQKQLDKIKNVKVDIDGDGMITDLDLCVMFLTDWNWRGPSLARKQFHLVRCWTSNVSYRVQIYLSVWLETERIMVTIDPLDRAVPSGYVRVEDITYDWRYWIWGGG
jgi:hypothetical protein